MLRDLTIKNYRCFKDFSIDGLARVNLIVGQNNSGKTSFLEAVYLLVNQQNPISLLEVLNNRGEFVDTAENHGLMDYQIAHLFNGHQPRANLKAPLPESVISLNSKSAGLGLGLRLSPSVVPLSEVEGSLLRDVIEYRSLALDLLIQYGTDSEDRIVNPVGHSARLPVSRELTTPARSVNLETPSNPYRFITTNAIDYRYLSELWNSITLTEKEDQVIQALRILESSLERMSFTSRRTSAGGILIKLAGASTPLPLSSLGDGMRRILALAVSTVTAENGVLLVDEIDAGLYHTTQVDMWRLLIETAQRLNVQIFATTHSWDCIVAFQEALAQMRNGHGDLGMLFRLQERGGKIIAVDYDAEKLDVAVDHMIEVR